MISPKPSISVNVDPTNPGQFFACCGLLELADRIWGGAEGWFDSPRFHVSVGSLEDLLAILVMDPPEEIHELASGLPVKPLLAPLRLSLDGGASTAITLDAWVTVKVEKNQAIAAPNQPWNFWSGQQTSFRIWRRPAYRSQGAVDIHEFGFPRRSFRPSGDAVGSLRLRPRSGLECP